MAEIIDQIVKISIQEAISSVTTVDVNTVALVGRNGTFATRVVDVTPSLKSGATGAQGSKKVTLKIADETFEITTTASDAVADVIDDLVAAVNNGTTGSKIFTASDGTSKLTLTAKATGFNDAEISVSSLDQNIILGPSSVSEVTAGVGTLEAFETASSDAVAARCGTDSEIYAMAMQFFAQDSQPSRIVCIPIGQSAANSEILDAVKAAAPNFAFYHVVVASNDEEFGLPLLTDPATGLQAWLAEAKKVSEIQVADASGLKDHGCDRVLVVQHTENTASGSRDFILPGVVGYVCALDSAGCTMAHKKCKGATPDTFDVDQYNALVDGGINVYTKVSGEARLFMGTTADKEHFLDQVIKDDWIRFNVQSRIYKLLGEGNNGKGVNYDDAGIASVAATVLDVISTAADTEHMYIMKDEYNVDYKPYSYLVKNYAEDVRKRNLPLISGNYKRMNYVHTVVSVKLQVTL